MSHLKAHDTKTWLVELETHGRIDERLNYFRENEPVMWLKELLLLGRLQEVDDGVALLKENKPDNW